MYKLLHIVWIALLLSAPTWSLADWQSITQQCSTIQGDVLVMECQSAGLVSNQRYTGAIHVSVEVLAGPIGTTERYWAGLALNSNVAADNQYAQIALSRGIEPFNDLSTPSAVLLSTTGKSSCCQVVQPVDPAVWHTLTLDYTSGRATYTVDGVARTVKVNLGHSSQVELLCVAVNPGESMPGALTRCQWRNLQITTRP
jgi:hypothetical protein